MNPDVINQSLLLFLWCFSASVTDGKSGAWRPWCFSHRWKDCCSLNKAASWSWLLRFTCTVGAARSMWLAELCGVMHGPPSPFRHRWKGHTQCSLPCSEAAGLSIFRAWRMRIFLTQSVFPSYGPFCQAGNLETVNCFSHVIRTIPSSPDSKC